MLNSSRNARRRRAALGAVAFSLLAAAPLSAATFIVNSTADSDDGFCGTAAGECTLREAIVAVVAAAGRDTIRFDATVFVPGSEPVRIDLGSALPIIADPAGTVVDGAGASVRVYGGGTIANGLVFASADGVALGKVTVANVAVQSFAGDGIRICGGVPPECGADVTGALVRNAVAVSCGGAGISVAGRINKKPRVVDSVTFSTGRDGIHLSASQALLGARVEGSTATRAGWSGIALRAEQQTGSVVVDSLGLNSEDAGIVMRDDGTTIKPVISNVAAYGNRNGIALTSYELVASTITDAVATGNTEVGVKMSAEFATAPVFTKIVADANGIHGINVEGGSGVTITRARVVGNLHSGIATETSANLGISDAIAAGNLTGIALGSSGGVTRVNASTNRGHGIHVLTPGGNAVFKNLALANGSDQSGIAIDQGSGGNVVRENVSLGTSYDVRDDNIDCGTNLWAANTFLVGGIKSCIR